MKLGIIGAKSIIDILIKVIKEETIDIDIVSVETEVITETPKKTRILEKQVDAILFTGVYNYYYTLAH